MYREQYEEYEYQSLSSKGKIVVEPETASSDGFQIDSLWESKFVFIPFS